MNCSASLLSASGMVQKDTIILFGRRNDGQVLFVGSGTACDVGCNLCDVVGEEMSVIVKGMDMPENCGKCFVGNREICVNGCPLVPVPPHYDMTRPSDCPLVEVPDPDEDKAFRRGAEAAWEAARKIMTRGPYNGGFDCMELEEIFDYPEVSKDIGSILEKFDAITAMYKIADYERKKADATHDIH